MQRLKIPAVAALLIAVFFGSLLRIDTAQAATWERNIPYLNSSSILVDAQSRVLACGFMTLSYDIRVKSMAILGSTGEIIKEEAQTPNTATHCGDDALTAIDKFGNKYVQFMTEFDGTVRYIDAYSSGGTRLWRSALPQPCLNHSSNVVADMEMGADGNVYVLHYGVPACTSYYSNLYVSAINPADGTTIRTTQVSVNGEYYADDNSLMPYAGGIVVVSRYAKQQIIYLNYSGQQIGQYPLKTGTESFFVNGETYAHDGTFYMQVVKSVARTATCDLTQVVERVEAYGPSGRIKDAQGQPAVHIPPNCTDPYAPMAALPSGVAMLSRQKVFQTGSHNYELVLLNRQLSVTARQALAQNVYGSADRNSTMPVWIRGMDNGGFVVGSQYFNTKRVVQSKLDAYNAHMGKVGSWMSDATGTSTVQKISDANRAALYQNSFFSIHSCVHELQYDPTNPHQKCTKVSKHVLNGLDLEYPRARVTGMVAAAQALPSYIALGDSYTSGEGDKDFGSRSNGHYLYGTDGDGAIEFGIDTTQEKCHVSDRSYPYLLGVSNNLATKSVACSGSVIGDVDGTRRDEGWKKYNGRYGQLGGLTDDNFAASILDAKESLKVGRTHQLDFISKYKPKVITIGIGGNDAGFGNVIQGCVVSPVTCTYAVDPVKNANLGKTIQDLYPKLKTLYAQTNSKSPNSKIYAVGYPMFVSPTASQCGLNVQLDGYERQLVVEGVKYMNQVVKRAAMDAGIGYLDIENSLSGKELCSGSTQTAVHGVSFGLPGDNLGIINNESFHPNPAGHALVADRIKTQVPNLLTYAYCTNAATICPTANTTAPVLPTYFSKAAATARLVAVMKEIVTKTVPVASFIQGLMPGTTVHYEIHSDPVALGDVAVDQNGVASGMLQIPAQVPAGAHTIVATVVTADGTTTTYEQPVIVTGKTTDQDEDGVTDTSDTCLFVAPASQDADADTIDDACDSDIDKRPPVITPVYASTQYTGQLPMTGPITTVNKPNSYGWFRGDVLIGWSVTDLMSSSYSSIPASLLASTEGKNVSYTSTSACDRANNCASAQTSVSLDKTAPIITAGTATAPNPAVTPTTKTVAQTATLTAKVTDSLSGVHRVEYYITTDPGLGKATAMTLSPAAATTTMPITGPLGTTATAKIGTTLKVGTYKLYIRVQDKAGNWSGAAAVTLKVV